MTDEVRNYLAPARAEWFWDWAERGDVVIWKRTRQTVTFRAELHEVLEHLSPDGLPPLDSILLILAACRHELNGALEFAARAFTKRGPQETKISLKPISDLPQALRTGVRAKKVVVEKILEHAQQRTSPELTQLILHELKTGPDAQTLTPPCESSPGTGIDQTRNRLVTLERGLRSLDANSLRLRVETGLEQIVEEFPIELPQSVGVRQLLEDIAEDRELSGLARAARRVTAAIRLPKSTEHDQELSVGGLADITNRGELDQLLLSELAHDDLVLTTRLAMNEALFVRRESPQEQSVRDKQILLDVGVRMWGVRRMLATAVALGLVARDSGDGTQAYRAFDGHAIPIDLSCREGLIHHLSQLDLNPTPAAALPEFRRLCADAAQSDVFIVSTTNVLEDFEFRISLNQCRFPNLYLVSISESGQVQIVRRVGANSHELASVQIDPLLLEIQNKAKPALQRTKTIAEELPAILKLDRFPMRLPAVRRSEIHGEQRNFWIIDNTGANVVLSSDRRVLLFDQANHDGIEIADGVPKGSVCWSATQLDNGISRALIHHQDSPTWHLFNVDVTEQTCTVVPCYESQPSLPGALLSAVEVAPHKVALVQMGTRIWKSILIDVKRNLVVEQDPLESDAPPFRPLTPLAPDPWGNNSNYFRSREDAQSWSVLICDNIRLEIMPFSLTMFFDHPEGDKIKTIFRVPGTPAPLARTEDQRLLISGQQKSLPNCHGPFYLRPSTSKLPYAENPKYELHEIEPYQFDSPFRKKFRACTISNDGSLLLLTGANDRYIVNRFELAANTIEIRYAKRRATPLEITNARPFKHRIAKHPRLRYAKWEDGSRIYLDRRGLLHLKSSAEDIPEMTIALRPPVPWQMSENVPVKGWSTNTGIRGAMARGVITKTDELADIMRNFIREVQS